MLLVDLGYALVPHREGGISTTTTSASERDTGTVSASWAVVVQCVNMVPTLLDACGVCQAEVKPRDIPVRHMGATWAPRYFLAPFGLASSRRRPGPSSARPHRGGSPRDPGVRRDDASRLCRRPSPVVIPGKAGIQRGLPVNGSSRAPIRSNGRGANPQGIPAFAGMTTARACISRE